MQGEGCLNMEKLKCSFIGIIRKSSYFLCELYNGPYSCGNGKIGVIVRGFKVPHH